MYKPFNDVVVGDIATDIQGEQYPVIEKGDAKAMLHKYRFRNPWGLEELEELGMPSDYPVIVCKADPSTLEGFDVLVFVYASDGALVKI